MFGHRRGRRRLQLAAMNDANADMTLSDLDVADLLIGQLLRHRLFHIGLDLIVTNERGRAHMARGLRIALREYRKSHAQRGDYCGQGFLHDELLSG